MPDRAPHACPGCGIATRTTRCATCEAARHRAIDARRPSSSRRYPWAWSKPHTGIRALHLSSEPLCRFCAERNRVEIATDVDHIDGDHTNHAPENLRSLCHSCHSARTMRDQVPNKRRRAKVV